MRLFINWKESTSSSGLTQNWKAGPQCWIEQCVADRLRTWVQGDGEVKEGRAASILKKDRNGALRRAAGRGPLRTGPIHWIFLVVGLGVRAICVPDPALFE